MANPESNVLGAALALAELGYTAVPLNAARKPILKGWPSASAGPAETRERFVQHRAAGLAIVMRHPLLVLDLDRGHADAADGVKTFAGLIRENGGDFPRNGPRVRSRRGGVHVYLRARDDCAVRSSTSLLGPGVDCKGARSCATAPPTSGYSWSKLPCHINDVPIAPAWLIGLVAPRPHKLTPPASLRAFTGEASPYALAALEREIFAVAMCSVGRRNAELFRAAARLGGLCAAGALDPEAVARGLLAAAEHCRLTHDDGAAAVVKTIANGLRAGASSPRAAPPMGDAHGAR